MKRFVLAPLTVLFAWLVVAVNPSTAQNTYPYQTPRYGPGYQTPFSPYFNLLLPGNTAVNYYALTQPQFQRRQYRSETRQTIQGLIQNQIPAPPGIGAEDLNAPMPSTGHPTSFNYTGSYFSTLTGRPSVDVNALAQRRRSAAPRGSGSSMGRMMGMGMMGMGGMGMGGMMGGGGIWPNMRPSMGASGR